MVLGRRFESQLHLKNKMEMIDHLMAEKLTIIIKTDKWGKSHLVADPTKLFFFANKEFLCFSLLS